LHHQPQALIFPITRIKIAQESGQEEEVYQQLLELNMQP
jgi:hypothetical protein